MERNFLVGTFECWDVYTATVSQGGSMKRKSSVRTNFSVVTCKAALGKWQGLGKSFPWGTSCPVTRWPLLC